MARLNFSTVFNKVVTLFRAVKTKDTADGASSAIKPYLAEQGIVLADDETAVNDAVAAHENFGIQERLMEEKSEARDDKFNPVFVDHMASVQFLKNLFRGNVTKLGEWGVTVDERGRIAYPTDFVGKTQAVNTFIAKHQSFAPGTSPLEPFVVENGVDLTVNKTAVIAATASHTEFTVALAAKETFREERDVLITPIIGHLRGIGQYLINLYHEQPHKAGQWGFTIDDSPQADVIRTGIVAAGGSKVLKNLNVGKTMKNIGPIPLKIFPGQSPEGTPVIINPGQTFEIIRGFGAMTVVNTDDEQNGEYEAVFNR